MTAGFELARFAWADGAFEVDGRWTGEPARSLGRARLVVEADGRRRRISGQGLRPRAEPDGAAWHGRFPCARPVEAGPAELEVGGTLVIELPAPELPPPPSPDVTQAEELLARLREERERLEASAERLAGERLLAEAAATALAQARAGAREASGDAERAAREVARAAAERAAGEAAERAVRNVAERVVREVAERAAAPAEAAPAAPPAPAVPPRTAAAAPRAEPPPTVPLPPTAPTTPRREAIREALERPREPRGVLGESPMRRRGIALALVALIAAIVAVLVLLLL